MSIYIYIYIHFRVDLIPNVRAREPSHGKKTSFRVQVPIRFIDVLLLAHIRKTR